MEFTRQSAFEIQESRKRTPKPIFSISGSWSNSRFAELRSLASNGTAVVLPEFDPRTL